jgi:hypothetical protein
MLTIGFRGGLVKNKAFYAVVQRLYMGLKEVSRRGAGRFQQDFRVLCRDAKVLCRNEMMPGRMGHPTFLPCPAGLQILKKTNLIITREGLTI